MLSLQSWEPANLTQHRSFSRRIFRWGLRLFDAAATSCSFTFMTAHWHRTDCKNFIKTSAFLLSASHCACFELLLKFPIAFALFSLRTTGLVSDASCWLQGYCEFATGFVTCLS